MTNEKETITKFLEWMQKNNIKTSCVPEEYYSCNNEGERYESIDKLFDLYQQETKQYTVGEVFDCVSKGQLPWSNQGSKDLLISFAEMYAELKAQNRIKP